MPGTSFPAAPGGTSEAQPSLPPVDVAAIAVSYNSAALLPGCLAGVRDALSDVESGAIVIVDNASADGSPEVVEATDPDAVVVRLDTNRGYAAGINAGLDLCDRAGAVLVLNPDVRLRPGSIRLLLDALATPGVGIAVPRLESETGELLPSLRREPTILRAFGEAVLGGRRAGRYPKLGEMVLDVGAYSHPTRADWATGAAMAISRSCLDAVGRWDESFFLYSEETDFALRARDAGFALELVPDAVAVHIGGDAHTSPWLWRILVVNRLRLFRRRRGRLPATAYWLALVVNEALRAAAPTHRAALWALLRGGRSAAPAP